MKYIILVIGSLMLFLYYNIYKFKRIKRRKLIKKMKVDDYIVELIDEFKKEVNNNSELKHIQNKMRITLIVKNIFYIVFIIVLALSPFIYIFLKTGLKGEIPSVDEIYMMLTVYVIFILTSIFAFWFIEIHILKKYLKNKNTLKDYIYNDFLKRIKSDIRWYEKPKLMNSEKDVRMVDTFINWDEKYKKASFNKIQIDEENYENDLLSSFSYSNKVYFEDYISGIYKEKYIISMSDFKEYIISGSMGRKTKHLQSEGVFCTIKIDKNIINDIRITSNKKYSFFMDKHYMITTMPDEFYKNFIILAKDGCQISEKISQKSIEIIEEFYDNSKTNFDVSIKEDEIFFRFKTIDTMELNIGRSIVDDLMLKEYANIIMFITKLSEEINNNWKVV